MERPRSLLRRVRRADPFAIDALLAAGLAATTLYELWTFRECPCVAAAQFRWSALFMATQTLPLALRRKYPFAVPLIVGISFALYDALDIPAARIGHSGLYGRSPGRQGPRGSWAPSLPGRVHSKRRVSWLSSPASCFGWTNSAGMGGRGSRESRRSPVAGSRRIWRLTSRLASR